MKTRSATNPFVNTAETKNIYIVDENKKKPEYWRVGSNAKAGRFVCKVAGDLVDNAESTLSVSLVRMIFADGKEAKKFEKVLKKHKCTFKRVAEASYEEMIEYPDGKQDIRYIFEVVYAVLTEQSGQFYAAVKEGRKQDDVYQLDAETFYEYYSPQGIAEREEREGKTIEAEVKEEAKEEQKDFALSEHVECDLVVIGIVFTDDDIVALTLLDENGTILFNEKCKPKTFKHLFAEKLKKTIFYEENKATFITWEISAAFAALKTLGGIDADFKKFSFIDLKDEVQKDFPDELKDLPSVAEHYNFGSEFNTDSAPDEAQLVLFVHDKLSKDGVQTS